MQSTARGNFSDPSTEKRIVDKSSQFSIGSCLEKHLTSTKRIVLQCVINICIELCKKSGIYSPIEMASSGFHYIDRGDAARCNDCGLEVSEWTIDMKPFAIHAERSPQCPFVCSMRPDRTMSISTPINSLTTASTTDENEIPTKRQKIEPIEEISQPNILVEVSMMKSIRRRTFSHWPHHISPSSAQMIAAGFFNCNTGDRVICIYCNLICQEWKANKDDPFETHRTRSPRCPYVLAQLKKQQTASIHIINEQSTGDERFQCIEIVYTAACHQAYVEIPRRHASFETWPNENLPSVDDLVRAGFFYAGTKTIVTCFYCNGSLQNWGAKDNPMIEHARWFPHCAYIKQLCGPEFYQRIQESKRAYQERNTSASATKESEQNNLRISRGVLIINDESTLSRYVAARLDLHIVQRLLDLKFKLSVIKRCYEDQFRFKRDDFASDCDVFIAVIILDKQIHYINGNKDNIVVPSRAVAVKQQNNQTEVEMSTSSDEQASPTVDTTTPEDHTVSSTPSNPCVLCLVEERRLACIPCGHLATCVACGHSLRSCPICRREINAFIRIYI